MRVAALAMYGNLAPLVEASDRVWAFLRDRLREAGLHDVPERLDREAAYDDTWLDPDLLLAQACGYPYVRRLRGKVRLVATPRYAHPGWTGALTASFVVVSEENPSRTVAELQGSVAVINDSDSNSGCNLLRALVAPLAQDGRFFSSVLRSGSHDASLEAVRSGRADAASVDCVTYGNIARFEPERLRGLRVLAQTPKGPGLPLITRGTADDAEVALLRRTLATAMADPGLADAFDRLSLTAFDVLADADYDVLESYEREATRLGYRLMA